jgi:hypothetical protein
MHRTKKGLQRYQLTIQTVLIVSGNMQQSNSQAKVKQAQQCLVSGG